MRILIYSYNYYPEPIGIAPLMTELAEGLVRRGHEVRVVTAMPWYPERRIYPKYQRKLYMTEKINGVAVQRNYLRVRPHPKLLDRVLLDASFVMISLVHALRGDRPDVILLTSPPLPVSVPAALLGWLHRCPVVLNLQDVLPEAAIRTGVLKNKWLIRVFQGLEKFAYQTATKISVISEGFRDNLLRKGVPKHKITVMPNWVDINFITCFEQNRTTNHFRTAYQLEDKFVVLYSGNIGLTQGLETVVKTAIRLRDFADIAFVIVGEEDALKKLQKSCQEHNANNVLLLPFQPREELPEMLAAADVSLVVQKENMSSFNMPSKIQVLLASGRAIIASIPNDSTAASAVLQSGGGILVPPEDPEALKEAILDLYWHPEKAKLLGKKGRKCAEEKYAYELALDRYEQLFVGLHLRTELRSQEPEEVGSQNVSKLNSKNQ